MRRFASGAIPTVDLYFRESLRDLIRDWPWQRGRPIERLGPTVFACGARAVVIRYADAAALRRLERRRPQAVDYLLDDNLWALEDDRFLPSDYRARLLRFRAEELPRILDLATHFLAPSERILRDGGRGGTLLQPAWVVPPAPDLSHFERAGRVRIVFPGSRSHRADLEFVAPLLAALARRRPAVEITTFLGRHAPEALRRLDNVRHRRPLAWPAFRRVLAAERFHLALVPLRDSRFNRSRSISKLYDVAAFGAAGLYSDGEPYRLAVRHGVDGRLLPNDPDAWEAALEALCADPAAAKSLAAGGRERALELGDPGRLRAFWLARLGLADRAA